MNTGGPAWLSLRSTNYLIYNSPKSCLITFIAYRCQQPNCGLGKQLGIWMPWRTGTILMRSSSTKVAAAENQGSLEDKKKSKWPLNWSGTVNSSGGQQSEILICRNKRTQAKNRWSGMYNTGDRQSTRGLGNLFLFCLGTAPSYFYEGECCQAPVSIKFPSKNSLSLYLHKLRCHSQVCKFTNL